ncbi:acyltransferase family protein [Aquimarina sp. 2201CG14-23]|uniref:acyltransferase family protein n=1 Tax=Aquimarina mycalae TaxID=3040073 RepID=UPI00247807F7|nr:acyltransferase [Aquimarina sp. 2201CG14-23]MDH7447493.1 acyltransferase [Aquimarina sp. 2201CG14-23]
MKLTIDQTNFLKGIGILLIMFHNFFHLLPPFIGENEFDWDATRVYKLGTTLFNSPSAFFNIAFSYFGHYGVQIFIVLSGYGLSMKYLQNNEKIKLVPFMINRVSKLYPVYVLSIIFLIITFLLRDSRVLNVYEMRDLLFNLSFVNNFLPNKALNINGPWWFFSLIVQLYAVFPLFFFLLKEKKMKYVHGIIFLILFYLIFVFLQPLLLKYDLNILFLFLGHLPEFVLGMVLAFKPEFYRKKYFLILLSIALFVLGNFIEFLFPLTFISISFFLVRSLIWLENYIHNAIRRNIITLGEISLYVFAFHGFLRQPFAQYSQEASETIKIVYAILFSIISLLIALFGKRIILFIKARIKINNNE